MTRLRSFLMLTAASLFSPMYLLASQPTLVSRPASLIGIGFGTVLMAGLVIVLIRQRFVAGATYVAILASLGLQFGGLAADSLFGSSFLLTLVALLVVMRLVWLLRGKEPIQFLFFAACLFFVASPLLTAAVSISRQGADEVVADSERGDFRQLRFQLRPDVVLVVLDSYAGRIALEQQFGFKNDQIERFLEGRRFHLPGSSWSSYPVTHLALPSLLEMGYVLDEELSLTPQGETTLQAMLGGENAVVETFKEQNYRITMVEAGYGRSRCGSTIDVCVLAPLYDDAIHGLTQLSILRPILEHRVVHPSTRASLASMTWLSSSIGALTHNESPDFVFAHLLIPHFPHFLDSSCEIQAEPMNAPALVRQPLESEARFLERKAAYIEQVECVNSFVEDFVELAGPETIIVFVGDHGTESLGHAQTIPELWTDEQLTERLNVFAALRTPRECGRHHTMVLPNVFRTIIGCLASRPVELLEPRLFAISASGERLVEVSGQRVSDLLASEPNS
ncbi:MAG TPA: sulfatase-like hydrolase/transferase [Acidimicrobiia bacterium]|nr:sulfatase-like hydrolase/transferase [Acidimicrobiia bacterium]